MKKPEGQNEGLIVKEIFTRDARGYLVRKRIYTKKYENQLDRLTPYLNHYSATRVQAVWRGYITRKWLVETEKDAERMLQQLEQQPGEESEEERKKREAEEKKEEKKGGEGKDEVEDANSDQLYESRPIVDFLENVIGTEKEEKEEPSSEEEGSGEEEEKPKKKKLKKKVIYLPFYLSNCPSIHHLPCYLSIHIHI